MQQSSTTQVVSAGEAYAHRLVIVALIATLATFLVAAVYPSDSAADVAMSLSFGAAHGWLAAQSFALTIPGLMLGLLVGRLRPRWGTWLGTALILAVPLIVFFDVVVFLWINERLLSHATLRIVPALLPGITVHASRVQIIQTAVQFLLICGSILLTWIVAGSVGRRWLARNDNVRPWVATLVAAGVAFVLALPALSSQDRLREEMAGSSTRNPWCAFHLVPHHPISVTVPRKDPSIHPQLRGLHAAPCVFQRDEQQRDIRIAGNQAEIRSGRLQRPDVIVVVIESLRPDMISPEVMPNLYRFTKKSIWCRNHFAGGNGTAYGIFCLVSGLEATWFERPIRDNPVMNRLLHQAGYELAFCGGHQSWLQFGMAKFLGPDAFDHVHTQWPDLPKTDRQTIEMTLRFVDGEDAKSKGAGKPPKAVLAYMYGTHSSEMYSDPDDQIFQPATQDNPKGAFASPEIRQQVWNGYRNSFRTMDRLIAPLLRDDCVVMVFGDHGESFMEDSARAHATRLSRYQNMTPAVISYPGVKPREIDHPTMHVDMLPTLMSILGLAVTPIGAIDGIDLDTATDEVFARRSFVSSHVNDKTSMLIGPWTLKADQPFAYRIVFDIDRWQAEYLSPMDERGSDLEATDVGQGKKQFRRWVSDRFGADAYTEASAEQLFTQLIRSKDPRVRLDALRIAKGIGSPEPYLYDLLVEAAADPDPEVRSRARQLVIRCHRIAHRD